MWVKGNNTNIPIKKSSSSLAVCTLFAGMKAFLLLSSCYQHMQMVQSAAAAASWITPHRPQMFRSSVLYSKNLDSDVVMDDHVAATTPDDADEDDDMSPFSLMVDNALNCLYKSDLKRQGGADGGSTGWTSWVEEKSAFQLEQVMNRVVLSSPIGVNEMAVNESDDESLKYIKWFKNSPVPMIVELTSEFREVAAQILERYPKILQEMKITDESDVLARLGCRLIVLPSGMELDQPLITSPGGMAYGKLLYGGAKRFRYLRSARKGVPTRITGESTSIKVTENDNPRSWVQFGGPERNYLALDMGPAAIVEGN